MRQKIKTLTSKKNETVVLEEDDLSSSIINPELTYRWEQNKPRNIRQMNMCTLVHTGIKRKKEKVLGEPYFLNTK